MTNRQLVLWFSLFTATNTRKLKYDGISAINLPKKLSYETWSSTNKHTTESGCQLYMNPFLQTEMRKYQVSSLSFEQSCKDYSSQYHQPFRNYEWGSNLMRDSNSQHSNNVCSISSVAQFVHPRCNFRSSLGLGKNLMGELPNKEIQ
jgi:hypothetical protein